MLTREDDIEAHALRKKGWSITAIARHLGRDRKTVRAYLNGDRVPGVRAKPVGRQLDHVDRFVDYLTARLGEDPHVWASTLLDEITDLGYTGSYPTLTRAIRDRGLRPRCQACSGVKSRPVAVIEHPPGVETQWDWVELPDPPEQWGWGSKAHLLVGVLAHSGKWRGVLCESEDQAHLIVGLDTVTRALGGVSQRWRFDRMATVCHPGSGRVTAVFAGVAKHYGVGVDICPPRSGNRKGVVEKAVHLAAQRIWRGMPDEVTVEQAQARFDDWGARRGDLRVRKRPDRPKESILELAKTERLTPAPTRPYPAIVTVTRRVTAQALVAYRGNHYSVGPENVGATVAVAVRLGGTHLDITTDPARTHPGTLPTVLARHRLEPPGAGVLVRDHQHVTALNAIAMAARPAQPHRRKERIPPGPAAIAAADTLRGTTQNTRSDTQNTENACAPIDLAAYARAAHGRNTLT